MTSPSEQEQEQSPAASPPSLASPLSTSKPELPFSLSLSALPSSFTTLLMSVVDSPAYSNLTSTYLNTVFNPLTPDDPRVKYFSVAGRTEGVSVWHPLWLPKMVLDGFEEKGREKLKKEWEEKKGRGGHIIPGRALWEQQDQWGNDGLVTVQSARWGEFLGILEGCDHWVMRGARGLELDFDFDIPLPPLGIGSAGANEKGDGWGLKDWGKFVGAWRKQEQREMRESENKRKLEEIRAGGTVIAASSDILREKHRTTQQERDREREREHDDAIVKSSTDKLSAVFDWVVDQVPTPPNLTSKDMSSAHTEMKQEKKSPAKNELATKMDLERFYVAMSRKLYDEGL